MIKRIIIELTEDDQQGFIAPIIHSVKQTITHLGKANIHVERKKGKVWENDNAREYGL